jgi:hypothetical protein
MLSLLLLGPALAVVTQQPIAESTTAAVRSCNAPKIEATKSPKIDGVLDDECWKFAEPVGDFIVSSPQFGKPSAYKTEVKLTYDNNAIYIAATMYDADPDKIKRQLSNRDEESNADYFAVGFDTYNDNQNGYKFQVSAAGVQTDVRASPGNYDYNWDAVWYSKVSLTQDGWVCEIKIPYSAIRFPDKDKQNWGLQLVRYVQRTRELSSWSPVNPQVNGIVNQWGELENLHNIEPPLRLSVIPYITGGFAKAPGASFQKILNGGMDINWGINESFTLNTTLVPDFGQVQSDNRVLNLGPFEQFFAERRPFFTEGTELFNKTIGQTPGRLFYSRRIGGTPSLYYNVQYNTAEEEIIEQNPSQVQLANATKISGRTKTGLGVGVLNAVGLPAFAKIRNSTTGATRKELTEPLTNYNVLVIDQTLKNNSRIGMVNTNVIRKGLWRDANVTQFNFDIRDKSNTFSYKGFTNLSQIYNRQISTAPQLGFYGYVGLSKISGNFRFDFEQYAISDKYDQNDIGYLSHANEVSNFIGLKYFDYQPKNKINNWDAYLGLQQTSLYKPFSYQAFEINTGATVVFKNFWYWGFQFNTKPVRYHDYYEARVENIFFNRQPYVYMNTYAGTDTRKDFFIEASAGFGESPVPNDPYFEANIVPSVRIKERVLISHNFFWGKDLKNFGFAGFNNNFEPIIGARKSTTVTNTFSFNYSINPRMNITLRARHYWSSADYISYHTLDENGNIATSDFNPQSNVSFNLWNLDFVYNWQFAPGSNLIVTWKQNMNNSDQAVNENYFRNAQKTFESPQTNSLTLKLIYYLDYQQVKELADKNRAVKNRA